MRSGMVAWVLVRWRVGSLRVAQRLPRRAGEINGKSWLVGYHPREIDNHERCRLVVNWIGRDALAGWMDSCVMEMRRSVESSKNSHRYRRRAFAAM